MQRNAFSADVSRRAQLMNGFRSGHFIEYRYADVLENIAKFSLPFSKPQRVFAAVAKSRGHTHTIVIRDCLNHGD